MTEPLVLTEGLSKRHHVGGASIQALANISLRIARGEFLSIVGRSGSGKSTLMSILGLLDRPDAGRYLLNGREVAELVEDTRASIRNREIGFVWQFHYLLPEFNALENVAMPLLARGEDPKPAMRRASEWLNEVGLSARAHHRAGELSGGEQQRVALARALISGPKLLLADEPTGDLDQRTADAVFDLISRLHAQHQLTSLIVTHNYSFARRCSRVLRLKGGRIEEIAPHLLTGA